MTTIKKGDFVIVGWNHLIPNLIEHITQNLGQRAVVLGTLDKGEIRTRFENANALNIFVDVNFEYVAVDYSSRDELEKLNIWNAGKIVIVYDEAISFSKGELANSGNTRDAKILFTMKTIKSLLDTRDYTPTILCEIFSKSNKFLFEEYNDVEVISKESLFSNVFSQSVIQDDILNVYKRLLKTDGKELYIVPFSTPDSSSVKANEHYYDRLSECAKKGFGLVGLYLRSKNGGKARVFLSPSEKEFEELSKEFSTNEYESNYILLAEDTKEVNKFSEHFKL